MTKLKLCYLASSESIHTRRWLTYFTDRGHQVHLITLHKPVRVKGVIIHHMSSIASRYKDIAFLLNYWKIKKIVKEIKPDILNGFFLVNYGFYAATLGYHPLVVSAFGSDVLVHPQKSRRFYRMAKFALEKADLVTSLAKFVEKPLIALGAKPNQIVTTPLGVDKTLLEQNSQQKEINITRQVPIIISTRFLEPTYNVVLLIRALPYILSKNQAIKCLIIGGGTQMEKLRKLAKNLKLENNIEFLGTLDHDELIRYLKMADIFISTSLSDINNVSLNEAMACGLFPVCTDIPANREWIDDGINGFLVPTNSPTKLAQKILEAWQNKQLIDTARKINWEIIQKRALWDNNMKKIEDSYYKLLEKFKYEKSS